MYIVWGIIILLLIALISMPKRLTVRESVIIAPIVGYFAWVSHVLIGVKLDFLDFGPTKQVEYTDWALVSLVPPLLAILYLNVHKEKQFLLYVVIWTVLSFMLEFILAKVGYMKHFEWKMWYSIPAYFVAYSALHCFFYKVVKRHSD